MNSIDTGHASRLYVSFAALLLHACATPVEEISVDVEPLGSHLSDSESTLGSPSTAEREKMIAYLNTRTPPSAIQAEVVVDDVPYDCVEIHRQWGGIADDPDDVPRAPGVLPPGLKGPRGGEWAGIRISRASKPEFPECPPDTVPMRRFGLQDLSKYTTLDGWLNRRGGPPQSIQPGASHEWASRGRKVNNIGLQASLNVWNPAIQTGLNEFSLMQLWVVSCTFKVDNQTCILGIDSFESVEAGWLVYPNHPVAGFGDGGPELFAYATQNGYTNSCWANECSQFVVTGNNHIGIGLNSSVFQGTQREIDLWWYRDPTGAHHWWLNYEGAWIGYFKNDDSYFDEPGLQNQARVFDVGGEIVNNGQGAHTSTQMGSGRCPSSFSPATAALTRAAYIRNIRYVTSGNTWASPEPFNRQAEFAPYDLGPLNPHGTGAGGGVHFYLGGEGDNPCP